jgi:hypothetical protein
MTSVYPDTKVFIPSNEIRVSRFIRRHISEEELRRRRRKRRRSLWSRRRRSRSRRGRRRLLDL